jgi:hypothetical protein
VNTVESNIITCFYRNETSGLQIVQIDEGSDFFLERVVIPGQCLMFEAPATASLQIRSNRMVTTISEDTIPCQQLQYSQDMAVIGAKVLVVSQAKPSPARNL